MTPEELAKAYVDTVYDMPSNGWGQNVHPTLGRSDYIMGRLRQMVGEDETERLIDAAIKQRSKP